MERSLAAYAGRNAWAVAQLADTLAMCGRVDEARGYLAELEDRAQREWIPPLAFVWIYHRLGEADKALEFMKASFAARDYWLANANVFPEFDPLRAVPELNEIFARVGVGGSGTATQ